MTARRSRTVRATPPWLAYWANTALTAEARGGCVRRAARTTLMLCAASLALLAVKHSGSVPLDEIIRIARIMKPKSLSKTFKGTVLEMLGTAQSTGCRVEGEDPHDIIDQIKEGTLAIPDA